MGHNESFLFEDMSLMLSAAPVESSTIIDSGTRIHVRDTDWNVDRVVRNSFGSIIEATGITGIARDRKVTIIPDYEQSPVQVVDPAAVTLVPDLSPGFLNTKLFLESAFRTTAPASLEPAVRGKAAIDDLPFQMLPVERALLQHRVRLLLGDDVGLGKTLEAGLVASELILRRRARRILVACSKAMLAQFQKEFWTRFSIPLTRLDSNRIQRMRNAIPTNRNPFDQFEKVIISIDTLKNDSQYGRALETGYWDLVIIDEGHNVAERRKNGLVSQKSRLAKLLSTRTDALLILTATPHDGSPESFSSLIAMLDSTVVADPSKIDREVVEDYVIRRFRNSQDVVRDLVGKVKDRLMTCRTFSLSAEEEEAYHLIETMRLDMDDQVVARKGRASDLFRTAVAKSIFSSPAACLQTVRRRLAKIEGEGGAGTPHDIATLRAIEKAVEAIDTEKFSKYRDFLRVIREQKWTGKNASDRLVVFSERIETLDWLQERIEHDLGLHPEQIAVINGASGMSDAKIQETVESFGQETSKYRVLLASDMASEGLNLHYQSHRLFHFDLPWSLLRFRQRNGRIDRYRQKQQPLMWYFVGKSVHEKVNDMWVLGVLLKKDEQAADDIGDPSALGGRVDAEDQDDWLTELLDRRAGTAGAIAEDKEQREANPFAFLDEEYAAAPDMPAAPVGGVDDALPSLFPSTFDFADAMLRLVEKDGMPLRVQTDLGARRISIDIPPDMKEKGTFGHAYGSRVNPRWMPEEGVKGDRIHLTDDRGTVNEAIETALALEESWPAVQYLWDVHPIMAWLGDKASRMFGRRSAPLCWLPNALEAGEVAVLLHGTVPNRKGTPIIDRWRIVRFTSGMRHEVVDVSQFLSRIALKNGPVNLGAHPDLTPEKVRHAAGRVAEAVGIFQHEISVVRRSLQAEIEDRSEPYLSRMGELERKHKQAIEARYASQPDLFGREARKTREVEAVERMFEDFMNWFGETQQMPNNERPYVDVVAVFRGN